VNRVQRAKLIPAMILDSAPLIDDFDMSVDLGPLPVARSSVATQNRYHEFSSLSSTEYSVQPWVAYSNDGSGLEQVPEGDRNSEHIDVYANNFVFRLKDVVTYDGFDWKVNHVDDYTNQGGVCFAMAVKLP
jgi:hypothetical protein